MAKKITISIPDEVHKNLQKFKDRFNVSFLCSGALRKTIAEVNESVAQAKRRFYLLSFEEACHIAFEEGIRWAGFRATAPQLAFLCEWVYDLSKNSTFEMLVDENNEVDKLYRETDNSIFTFVLNEGFLEDVLPRFLNEENQDIPIIMQFREGAMTIWKEIKSQVIRELLKDPDERIL